MLGFYAPAHGAGMEMTLRFANNVRRPDQHRPQSRRGVFKQKLSPMQTRNCRDNGKSKTCTRGGAAGIKAHKRVNRTGAVLGAYADAAILHRN